MITLCSVMLNSIKHYEEIFIKSILERTKVVSEVVLAQNDVTEGTLDEAWVERGISFRRIGSKPVDGTKESAAFGCCGDQHGYGLNFAIDRAKNDYVYLCDPDIFFYSAVDELFHSLMTRHSLQAVGCSHHSATEIVQTFFPWHGNIMMRKDSLPGVDWMPEIHSVPGRFLMAGIGHTLREQYPNPNGNFDTSSGLILWANQQNWTWLSFQTTVVHAYNTKFFRSNKPFKNKVPLQKLIYHGVSGSIEKEKWEPFQAAYLASLMEDE